MTTLFANLYAVLRALFLGGFFAGGAQLPAVEIADSSDSTAAAPPAAPTAAEDEKAPAAGPFGQSRLYVGF